MKNRIIRANEKKRLPIIGKIKCGEIVKRDGKEFPTSLDYFVADGNYKHIFDKKFKKPDKLDIVFISDDISECCVEHLEIRQGSKLFAKGDGFTFEVYDKKTDKYIIRTIDQEPDLISKIETECQSKFEEILTLYFLIIGINEVFGVWRFQTKGKESSIPGIISSFDKTLETAGRVKFIPFTLSVEKVKSQKPGSKNLFPVVSLVANIGQEYMEKLQDHMEEIASIRGVITEDKIENVMNLQIEDKTENVNLEFNIVPQFKEKIKNCKDIEKMKSLGLEIKSLNLTDKYRDELKKAYLQRLQEIQ